MMMRVDRPRRNVPLSTQLAEQIRERISSGEWPVGSKIPAESELVTQLEISRNSVREALRSLVHAGLLEARAGDGTYVRADSELQVALHRLVRTERSTDVFEVRSLLERHGARLAATHATDQDVNLMRQALRSRDSAADARQFIESDLAFHRTVVDASGNPLLAKIYRDLDDVAAHLEDATRAEDTFEAFLNASRALNERHQELLSAITAREPEHADTLAGQIVLEAHGLPLR